MWLEIFPPHFPIRVYVVKFQKEIVKLFYYWSISKTNSIWVIMEFESLKQIKNKYYKWNGWWFYIKYGFVIVFYSWNKHEQENVFWGFMDFNRMGNWTMEISETFFSIPNVIKNFHSIEIYFNFRHGEKKVINRNIVIIIIILL